MAFQQRKWWTDTVLQTSDTVENMSWKIYRYSDHQELYHCQGFRGPNFMFKRLDSFPSHFHPAQTFNLLPAIHILILSSHLALSFPSDSSTSHLILLDLITPKSAREKYKLWSLSTCNFVYPSLPLCYAQALSSELSSKTQSFNMKKLFTRESQ